MKIDIEAVYVPNDPRIHGYFCHKKKNRASRLLKHYNSPFYVWQFVDGKIHEYHSPKGAEHSSFRGLVVLMSVEQFIKFAKSIGETPHEETRTIIIDGKEIKISEESFQAFRKQFLQDG